MPGDGRLSLGFVARPAVAEGAAVQRVCGGVFDPLHGKVGGDVLQRRDGDQAATATNRLSPLPMLSGSTRAMRRRITPEASSFWMRRQQGVGDSATRSAICATDNVASSCNHPINLRSISSMRRSGAIMKEMVRCQARMRRIVPWRG